MFAWVSSRAERLLKLRDGDLGRGSLLFACYFLTISSYVVGQVARDALFLDRFTPKDLPYVDVSIALVVGFVVAGYIRAGRAFRLGGLISGTLALFAAIAGLFWWSLTEYRWDWLYPALYIWVGIFGVLTVAQVWTLANFVLTTREAKRIFGLVGSGGILGGIAGGFAGSRIARAFGTESLLILVSFLFCVCSVLVVLVWKRRTGEESAAGNEPERKRHDSSLSLRESLRLLVSSPHLMSIATLICIASIVTTAAGWQFKAVAKASLIDTDVLAGFLGSFQGYTGVLALGTQLLLTPRILQRFGIGIALMILPVALSIGSISVFLSGSLFAATFLKGSDKVLRYSVDTAALQLLYLPVATRIKLGVKSFIDTVVWRFGDGLAGVTLLIFVTYLRLSPQQVSAIGLVFLGGWFLAARRARREYLSTLEARLREHRVDTERATAPVLDRSTTALIASSLSSPDTKEILYGLKMFETGYHRIAHPAMYELLGHESPEVRARVLATLNAAGDESVEKQALALLNDPDLNVRTEALSYLSHHGSIDPVAQIEELGVFPDFTLRSSLAAFFTRPGTGQNLEAARLMIEMMLNESGAEGRESKLEAARLIGRFPEPFSAEIVRLFEDPDPRVVRYAIEAAGKLGQVRFVPVLVRSLDGNPDCREAAISALAGFGNRILGMLNDYLDDPETPSAVRLEIPKVVLDIGTREAERMLASNLLQGDTELRFRILSALNKFQMKDPKEVRDLELMETVLVGEILGHYRSYQALGVLSSRLGETDPALVAFMESIDRELERIFRLLGILFPEHDLQAAFFGIRSEDSRIRDDTVEFLDSVLKPELRSLLIPLVDPQVSIEERILCADKLVGDSVHTPEAAVTMLIRSGDPWLRSCGAYVIGAFGLRSLEPELEVLGKDSDPLLLETVRQARMRLASIAIETE